MLLGNEKDPMDPKDMRNLLIFMALALVIYFSYENIILKPKREAIAEAQRQERLIAQAELERNAQLSAQGLPVGPVAREDVISSPDRIKLDNGQIFGTISLTGARIDDISLEQYYKELGGDDNVVLLSPKDTAASRYIEHGWVAADDSVVVPDAQTRWNLRGDTEELKQGAPVTLYWDNGQGITFERILFLDENYMFTVTQRVINNSGRRVTLYPYGLISQQGIPENYAKTWILHEGPIGYIGNSLSEINYADLRKGKGFDARAQEGWIGVTDKYWLTALIPPQGQDVKYKFDYNGLSRDPENKGRYQVDFVGAGLVLASGQSGETTSHVFTGAKQVSLLNQYRDNLNIPKFDLAVNFGWFWFLAKPFFHLLHFLRESIGNMGLAIIALTLLIRGAVFPLTNASYRSFAKMKKVTPQVAEIREAYGDNKQKLQEELMKLYQKEGVNPMAGCFPILLQIPIFFALYKVIFVTIELRHAPFFGWIKDLSAPDPTSVFNLFGLIPWEPPAFLHIGVWPCVMLIAMLIQKKLNPPPQDKLQRDMMNYFPFIITYALSRFASGLVIYWTFSAIIGVIQQIIIMRSLNVPIYLFGQSEEDKKLEEAMKHGPDVHPLAEMAEDEVEEALFGDHDDDDGAAKAVTPPKPKKKKKKK